MGLKMISKLLSWQSCFSNSSFEAGDLGWQNACVLENLVCFAVVFIAGDEQKLNKTPCNKPLMLHSAHVVQNAFTSSFASLFLFAGPAQPHMPICESIVSFVVDVDFLTQSQCCVVIINLFKHIVKVSHRWNSRSAPVSIDIIRSERKCALGMREQRQFEAVLD